MNDAFIVTCEHGGNRIPPAYARLFRELRQALASHRGYDPGALVMAMALAGALQAPLVSSTTSRLLIDLNRPIRHPQLYSEATRDAPAALRAEIARRYHQPYWTKVEELVRKAAASGRRVIHISSHSFAPTLAGEVRRADVGLLYHPARHGEAALCSRWKAALAESAPTLLVRRNYPYHGTAAGLASHLRRRFPATAYVGVELEVNQRKVLATGQRWSSLRAMLIETLHAACAA